MITVEVKDEQISAVFDRLSASLSDMSDVMNEVGMTMVASSEARIDRGEAVDGTPFAPRSAATLAAYQRAGISFGPFPLKKSGDLRRNISHTYGPTSVEIGTNLIYAAMMQFGGTKAQHPNLWGDIPARPFLGISDEDRANIIDIVEEWLTRTSEGGV